MWATSAALSARCQYCITMAMLAAPQPSSGCFTKGTSSQWPVCAGAQMAHKLMIETVHGRRMPLRNYNYDNNQRHAQYDQRDIERAQVTGGEIMLRLISFGRELRQILIAQLRNRFFHLLGVDVGLFQSVSGYRIGQELLHLLYVLLAHLRGGNRLLLQIGGGYHMRALRGQSYGKGKQRNQRRDCALANPLASYKH
jgi:hypothetical protein